MPDESKCAARRDEPTEEHRAKFRCPAYEVVRSRGAYAGSDCTGAARAACDALKSRCLAASLYRASDGIISLTAILHVIDTLDDSW